MAEGASEQELRGRFTEQGFLVYSVRPRKVLAGVAVRGFQRR